MEQDVLCCHSCSEGLRHDVHCTLGLPTNNVL